MQIHNFIHLATKYTSNTITMESVKQTITEMSDLFNTRMAAFQQELQAASQQSSSPTSNLTAEFNTFKSFVVSALRSLQKQIEVLSDLHDQSEMKARRKILLVHGVSEDQKDVPQILTKLFKSQLKLADIGMEAVKYCHRLGRQAARPRPILIKFENTTTRNKVWGAKSNLKDSGVTVSEFLTRRRHSIFMAARQRHGLKKCWTRDGAILVIGPDGTINRVSTMEDLDAIPHSSQKAVSPSAAVPVPVTTNAKVPPTTRAKKSNKK